MKIITLARRSDNCPGSAFVAQFVNNEHYDDNKQL